MSGVQEAIAVLDATPVDVLVQGSYVLVARGLNKDTPLPIRCAVGVLARAAGVADTVLMKHECSKIADAEDIAWPVMNHFGLDIRRLVSLQDAFDNASSPVSGKDAALTLLRRWA